MELWFSHWWRSSTKNINAAPVKPVIGILTFEVACLMLKIIHLWKCLSDKKMTHLREEVINSTGIQKLVSNDEDYLMDLVLSEILDCFKYLVKSVARLGKKCTKPMYHHLEHIFDDPIEIDLNWVHWEYMSKKMEKKIKKMERFIAVTSQLHQELEVMAELEQILKIMQANVEIDQVKLFEFQRKVMWQRLEVKSLREMSPWIQTYDYTVRILLRTLFTIFERIKYVFEAADLEAINDSDFSTDGCLVCSRSISAHMQSSVHPSESNTIRRSVSNLGHSFINNGSFNKKPKACKHPFARTRRLAHVAPFKGCMMGGTGSTGSPIRTLTKTGSMRSSGDFQKDTLSYAGLSLHYANVIISIEKLASSPHSIGLDARDDLYNMLPSSIRASMREKLKLHEKSLGDSTKDGAFIAERSLKVARILEWLAPLAHDTMRWHLERNFEKKRMVSRLNALLVQTLYFANLEKTETAMTELLIGLSYISRFGREINN